MMLAIKPDVAFNSVHIGLFYAPMVIPQINHNEIMELNNRYSN